VLFKQTNKQNNMALAVSRPASSSTSRRIGVSARDVAAESLVRAFADHLKKSTKMRLPAWHDIVKTGVHKQLAPYDPDWYYIRAASLARQVYLRDGIGVGMLRRMYGGPYCRGSRCPTFSKASGKIIRHILRQLEELGLLETLGTGGRRMTAKGQRDLDRIAAQVFTQASAPVATATAAATATATTTTTTTTTATAATVA